ncbi:MAG: hypothetical protein HY910_00560 [Desulfarculus sp.]|nr:hypothetical protein [Desulfarculus sp.]
MLLLLETTIAFVVIMLTLSFLTKSLTSLIKNHLDYYSANLKGEFEHLIKASVGGTWEDWQKDVPWLKDLRWDRLGEEFLGKENLTRILLAMEAPLVVIDSLDDRIKVHLQNIKYAFETRTKNITLALGMGICLILNINAFTIWTTLYSDQVVRGKLIEPAKIEALLHPPQQAAKPKQEQDPPEQDKSLQEIRQNFMSQVSKLRTDMSFGVGRLWSKDFPQGEAYRQHGPWVAMLFEFTGSLLTGLLLSIGAPYWHDLLRRLVALRPTRK